MEKDVKKGRIFRKIAAVIVAVSVLGCIVSIFSTKATLAEKREELAALKEKAQQIEDENGEYERILSNENMDDYMEQVAIDKMNYAYPNEIRFYDTSRN